MKGLFAALALALFASPAFAQGWSTAPHDPANFTASGSMKWQVPVPSPVRYKIIDGNTMIINFSLQGVTVSGVSDVELRMKIPEGRNANVVVSTIAVLENWNKTNFSQQAVGIVMVANMANSYLQFRKLDHSKWSLANGTTYLFGQVVLELVGPTK